MKWKIKQTAEEEKRKGGRVRIGYGKLWIDDRWWHWDEGEEVLRDRNGKRRGREVREIMCEEEERKE